MIVCSPSASAWRLTASEPGTTSMRTCSATLRPRSTPATARRSSMRPLVHEPTNTTSTLRPISGASPLKPMYERLRAATWSRCAGTFLSTAITWPGLVPQVTVGRTSAASITTSRS